MKKLIAPNVGLADRVVRVVLGLGLLSLTAVGPHSLWGLVGIIPVSTALLGSCPLYSLVGLSTRSRDVGPASHAP